MSITVATEGNRRKGDMSRDEVSQCIFDIKSWFCRKTSLEDDFSPATTADFQKLQKALEVDLPDALESLLQVINGGMYFMDKKSFSAQEIVDAICAAEARGNWQPELIPFCGDDDTLYAINTKTGHVVEWEVADGVGDTIAVSFSRYLEDYRNALLAGHMEYLSGIGVVESMTGGSRK